MSSNQWTLIAATLAVGCAGTRHAGQLGVANLSDDYDPVDQQLTLGWSMSRDLESTGLGYELGAQVGVDSEDVQGVELTSANFELYGGPRFEFVFDAVRPYLSGGLSLLSTDFEGEQGVVTVSDSDTTIGLYLGGGIDFDITERFFLGLGLRGTFGHDPELFGVSGDGDFTQVFLRFGSSF